MKIAENVSQLSVQISLKLSIEIHQNRKHFFNTNLFNFSNTTNAYISCQKQENFCCDIRSPIVLGQIMVSNELAFADFAKIILLFIFFITIY
ncbi:hypothetical protein HW49_06755 [Porphyromonadaceae bacterium COT-184 OH4590]|nr:hypothetical protein HW49_06755 [Porphyromonadaceae bacterium COT-184 OH4590]